MGEPLAGAVGIARSLTGEIAQAALGADVGVDAHPQRLVARGQSQQGAEGTQPSAPEAGHHHRRGEDDEKQGGEQSALAEVDRLEGKEVVPAHFLPYSTLKGEYSRGKIEYNIGDVHYMNRDEVRFITLTHYNQLAGTHYATVTELLFSPPTFEEEIEVRKKLGITPYVRIAHGWATPSNLNDIITGNTEKDPYNNQLTSLFYGYPLTDKLFGLPLDFYLTPGFVYHHSSEVQSTTQEYVLAIKAYYTFPLPWEVRFGFAEGISYIDEVSYIEQTEMDEKGYRSSNLLNYLDFSLDLHLGDVFGEKLDQIWLGYSIHYRSAIFQSSSCFGRIKGGSNYNSVYLHWHY